MSGISHDRSKGRRRPALFRALGRAEPPPRVVVGGIEYHLRDIYKHDSWAATALYNDASGRGITCKFNREAPIFGIPMRWLGHRLAARESRFLRQLADLDLVPDDCGPVSCEGRRRRNAVARRHVKGEVFRTAEQVDAAFFEELQGLLAAVHGHGVAYVDLHKRENIIIDEAGRPHLIDFQVSFGLTRRWPGNGRLARALLARLQEMDDYHFRKHFVRCLGATAARAAGLEKVEPPALIRWHRRLSVPLRQLRRRLLAALRIRGESGMAHTEAEPEAAFRVRPRQRDETPGAGGTSRERGPDS